MRRLILAALVVAVLAGCASGSPANQSRGTVAGCASAIAAGEENGTMHRDSPAPAQCQGLTRAELAQAVTDALDAYLAYQDASTPAPRPTAYLVHGHLYDCGVVRQAVESDEHYTPDGYPVYAVLLMDCDI